jgi:glutamyl-tRNA synthetase/nondiscriminating glutamyl-tRNA synthetase
LEADRALAVKEHRPQIYSRRCAEIDPQDSTKRAKAGEMFAVRLRIGAEPLRFHDVLRGMVEFAAETVSDPILVRSAMGSSAGVPVYNYVVTIDDALMEITHVIRGDDHISNTPKQVAIYQAFGWTAPEFAHLSTILGEDHQRLSKRQGATSIASFRDMGYLPEALANYLALLGWGAKDGKSETFTLTDLIKEFSLERVTTSPAVFSVDKLNWLNRHYLKASAPDRVAELSWKYFDKLPLRETAAPEVRDWFNHLLALFVPSIDHLDQLPGKCAFLFGYDIEAAHNDPENAAILTSDSTRSVLGEFAARVRTHMGSITPEVFKGWMNDIKAATGVKGKELFHPVRIALTGAHSGPEFDKLIPLLEEGSALGLGVPSVEERVERFVSQ